VDSLNGLVLMRKSDDSMRNPKSVEEFVTPEKSRQAFDADIASYGILALLVRVENGGTESYGVQRNHITAFLGGQHLPQLTGEQAA